MPEQFDVIVIGGGCNGTGIARDGALRGLKVLLLEKKDFAAGTTGASSGMIHGGPRYLFSDVGTTKLSSKDAGTIRRIAPHLCFRIPFVYPELRDDTPLWKKKVRLSLVEAFFEAYDRFSELKGGKRHTRLTGEEVLQLEPGVSKDVVGAVTFDEWGILTDRLCVANARSAYEAGAEVKNHTEVLSIQRDGNRVIGLLARDLLTGEELEHRARIVFNAAGPWGPRIARMAGVEVKLRPAKGIHLVLDRRISNVAIVSRCIDGREIFINPHGNTTLLGTTDDDFYGDLDDIGVSEDEVEYLLQAMEKTFPEIRKARIVTTTRGVRPTLHRYGVSEDDLSREHKIFDHEKEDQVEGFLSIGGGKLAAFRQMAEEATDLICKKIGRLALCKTHTLPLPGGEGIPQPSSLAEEYKINPYVAERLICRHGGLSRAVLAQTIKNPEKKAIVCPCEPVIEAEVSYVAQKEWARTLGDIERRTRLGSGTCQGLQCLLAALGRLVEEVKDNPRLEDPLQELRSYLDESWKGRAPILKGAQLAQEELLQMTFQGVLGL
jgi:glycerol-3-phosphate dehydrogenase